jgi:hypothetical protein
MNISNKMLLWLAAAAGGLSAASFIWWSQLISAGFASCVAAAVPTGVDCRHEPPLFTAIGLAGVAVLLASVVLVRVARIAMGARQAA